MTHDWFENPIKRKSSWSRHGFIFLFGEGTGAMSPSVVVPTGMCVNGAFPYF